MAREIGEGPDVGAVGRELGALVAVVHEEHERVVEEGATQRRRRDEETGGEGAAHPRSVPLLAGATNTPGVWRAGRGM